MAVSTTDTLRKTTDIAGGIHPDALRPGTVTGDASKGYGDFHCNGSEYNKFGNRVDLSQMAATNLK